MILSYEDPDTGCYIVSTYLDDDDTADQFPTPEEIIEDELSISFRLEDILEEIASSQFEDFLEACGEVGSQYLAAIEIVLAIRTAGTLAAAYDIEDAGGYAQITNAYDPIERVKASVVSGWHEYPYVEITTRLIDPQLEAF